MLLHRPLHVPVGLGDEEEVRVDVLRPPDQRRPVVGLRRGPGSFSPGAGEDLVGHQHCHVAAKPVALAADPDQRLGHGVAQGGREGVELDHVGPRRQVGVAALADHAGGGAKERLGVLFELLVTAGQQAVRALGCPRMIGRHVVGDVVEDQPQPPVGQLRPGRRQGVGAAEALVHDVVAHAVGGADHVLRAEIRKRGPVGRLQPGIGQRDLETGGAPAPDAHQPDRVDRQGRQGVPLGVGHFTELERALALAPEPLEPDRRVDLVDGGAWGQAHGGFAQPVRPAAAAASACSAGPSTKSIATVPVQPVWWLAPIPAPLSP